MDEDHAGHPATFGPSALSNKANPEGTTLDRHSASFIAANASPFVSVDDLVPEGARVIDPETTSRTCCTSLNARLQVPVINYGDQGKLMVIMSADPLSQVPVWISRTIGEPSGTLSDATAENYYWSEIGLGTGQPLCDPHSWGQIWERVGLDDFFAQTAQLGDMAQRYRVVGAAMRVNLGTDTTISRGSIEAGQFQWADTKKAPFTQKVNWSTDYNDKSVQRKGWWAAHLTGTNNTAASTALAGFAKQKGMANLISSCGYETGKRMVRGARNQDWGILDADKGASVRWTDTNDFTFQKSYNRNLVSPDRNTYPNGLVTNISTSATNIDPGEDNPGTTTFSDEIVYKNVNSRRAENFSDIPTSSSPSKLAVKTYQKASYNSASTTLTGGNPPRYYFGADNYNLIELCSGTDSTINLGQIDITELGTIDGKGLFDTGLYCDITGVSPTQTAMIDVVWHIEFEPRSFSILRGIYPPINMQFDLISAMLRDPKHFPIVVQGHSFFSSLWRGIKKAASKIPGIANAASKMLVASGVPELQGVGGAISTGLATYQSFGGHM